VTRGGTWGLVHPYFWALSACAITRCPGFGNLRTANGRTGNMRSKVLFCHENSRKVDEQLSLFFMKNFTETKESRFGYFCVKIHTN